VSGSVLWGVLAITAFSLLGFGLLASAGLMQRLPARLRTRIGKLGAALHAALLSFALYLWFFAADGLVAQGSLTRDVAWAVWAAASAGLGILAVRAVLRSSEGTTP
jgi:hypothetical protein